MFFDNTWLDVVTRGVVLATLGIVWIVLLIRLNGLRSLSKMTNFDFVMTIGLGSLLASLSQASDWQGFVQGLAGIVGLFLAQYIAARVRKSSDTIEQAIENQPVLLMRDGEFLHDAMDSVRVGKDDLIAKLREANVLSMSSVRAVVLETTGDVSVLHGDKLDEELLAHVERSA